MSEETTLSLVAAGGDPAARSRQWGTRPEHEALPWPARAAGITLLSLLFIVFAVVAHAAQCAFTDPSIVSVQGSKLLVQARQMDGSLDLARPYRMRGVNWAPASEGSTVDDRQAQYAVRAPSDIPLMSAMNVNTVRVFLDFGTGQAACDVLDALHRHGIMAIVTVDRMENDTSNAAAVVTAYKNHPAVLMWSLGNEWNVNDGGPYFKNKFSDLTSAAKATNDAAGQIKALDSNHPVASSLGDINIPGQDIRGIVNTHAPSVDLWGLNIFRGRSLGTLFTEWANISAKPMFVGEFGTDAFNQGTQSEDQAAQAMFNAGLWDEIVVNLSADDPQKVAIGGCLFEWNDEWWKAGNPSAHDNGGFPSNGHPDGFSNEEWLGVVDISRNKRQVFFTFATKFVPSDPVLSVTPAAHDFGSVEVGGSADRSFTITNIGAGALSGTSGATTPFAVMVGGSYSLPSGASQTVTVRFSPTSIATVASNVTFTSSGGNASPGVTGTGSTPTAFTLTVATRGSAGGTVTSSPTGITCGSTCSASFSSGTPLTLTADAASGATFKQWGGACSGTSTSCTLTMSTARSVTAVFSKVFTDTALTAQSSTIKALHVTELRSAIDTLRDRNAGLAAFPWTDATLSAGVTPIKRLHLVELRTALDAAYQAVGQTLPAYTDPTLTAGQTLVKASHITELRSAVRTPEPLVGANAPSGAGSLADITLSTPSPVVTTIPPELAPQPLAPAGGKAAAPVPGPPSPAAASLPPAPAPPSAPPPGPVAMAPDHSALASTTASLVGPGTVMVSDPAEATPVRVAGVVAPPLGRLVGEAGAATLEVVRSGIVVVHADARYGAIAVGDLLVTSPTPGYVMRAGIEAPADPATPWSGALVGEALQPLAEGQGEILVLLRA